MSAIATLAPAGAMAADTGSGLLDLVPPSGHGGIFALVLGRLRLQDLQASPLWPALQATRQSLQYCLRAGPPSVLQAAAPCYCWGSAEDLEVCRQALGR